MKNQKNSKIILYDSYIQAIKNSVGSNLFRNLYLKINGGRVDVLENGNLSCAVFVSWILYIFKLVSDTHATVAGTVADLKNSGWQKINKPRVGCVIEWEPKLINGGVNKHIGFYVGQKKAISNSNKKRTPIMHHWTYNNKRKVTNMFWHNKLNK